ncbi:MAG: SHOCT domain-containing protein [Verrucomicrobia bacterium]|nr:SHOCT domain-containing protein [Verrucomicrobiota bacterium]MBU1909394.1 SHOCT domain-containing protein [Verrucomicrobiota bacterium]
MTLADELVKLEKLKQSGALSEEEFQQSKKMLLQDKPLTSPPPQDATNATLGTAANRYVSFQITMGIIGLIIMIIVLIKIFSRIDKIQHFKIFPDARLEQLKGRQ